MNMKIEAGKYYRARVGKVFGPMERDPSDGNFPWCLGLGGPEICWTKGGQWSLDGKEWPFDLVAEVHVSDTPPETAPAPEAKTLRDEIAMEAMSGLVRQYDSSYTIACIAYEHADAMMEARKK
jgi:hypothetical protein